MILTLLADPAAADAPPPRGDGAIRVAVYAAPLSRRGPGLLLRDIEAGEAQAAAAARIVAATAPDILLLAEFDRDLDAAALRAFAQAAGMAGAQALSPVSNAGMATGLDMDGDGRTGRWRDAQGFGRFDGNGAMALLSRWPATVERDLTALPWRDLPDARLPVHADGTPFPSEAALAAQRLSSTGHWIVRVDAPTGPLRLLAWSATPPVFDGPEDRNGRRAADEAALWRHLLDGRMGPAPPRPFVLLGKSNVDPLAGDGMRAEMAALLSDPRLADPRPSSAGGAAAGDATDTADWDDPVPGNLRVTYALPSADLSIADSGVVWPEGGELAGTAEEAGPHRLVWVDVIP
ncbi:MAG: endonuclease/exonuclease/phosphatase family protein [Paracoccaceae bacterium]